MARGKFVHCHVHSQYSLLDGASRVGDLVKRAVKLEMPAIALTDHGVMHGAVEFYNYAKKAGIKPILGMEAYMAFGDRRDKTPAKTGKNYGHLILLARNHRGYENLVKLNTIGHVEGYYHKPRIDREVLEEFHDGLIALSACIGGHVPQLVLQGRYEEAEQLALWYQGVFGEDFYLELQDHGLPEQHRVNSAFIELSGRTGIPLVATNDTHYTEPEDTRAHDALICIGTGKSLADPARKMSYGPEFYVKSGEQMAEIFHEVPIAISNTLEIASKCNVVLELGRNRLPVYPVPEGHSAESYLVQLAEEGMRRRYGDPPPEHVEERLRYELSIITSMGFPAYFLIVWDFIHWAKSAGIPVGPGRGSAAGSLVSYCLAITDIDPVRYNLMFERFLNPERVSMPDIDVDICIDRRNEVIRYTREKYGEDRVAQIVTFSTLKAKAAIKDVARVMELPFAESNELAKKVPDELNITLEQALEKSAELREAAENNPKVNEILDMARKLEGLTRATSIHAAGVIIAEEPIDRLVPLQRLKDSSDGGVATQYEQKYVEMLGLLKMDFLGLRNLTMIGKALDMIEKNHGQRPDFSTQDFTDPMAYELLQRGESVGLFQVESEGMTKLLKRLKPTCFEDISAVNALYRPGPIQSGYVDKYVDRKLGKAPIEYPHPALEPILKDTYGTMVYQEQIMQIAQVLAGYSLGGADLLRRAMGKKKKEEMDKQRSVFMEGCERNGVDLKVAESIFDDMEKFSEYCFNRAHTAAYGVLTYQTAYLKAHYPAEYMAALLSSLVGSMDKIMLTILDCRRMGLNVLPPDVNFSASDFSVVVGDVRFGLGAVKNVGLPAVEEILRKREAAGGRYKDVYDFFERIDHRIVNKKCLESLILCGALDSFGIDRALLLGFDGYNLEALCEWADRLQKGASSNQVSLFAGFEEEIIVPKPQLRETPSMDPDLALKNEKDLLGLYLTGHPLDTLPIRLEWHTTTSCQEVERIAASTPTDPSRRWQDAKIVVVGGLMHSTRKILTKKGDAMITGKLEDRSGTVDVVAFPKRYDTFAGLLVEDARLLIKGKVSSSNDDRVQVEIEHVWELGGLASLHLTLPDLADPVALVRLKEALKQHKGETPVILHFDGRLEQVVVGEAFWVERSSGLDTVLEAMFPAPGAVAWTDPRPLLRAV